MLTSSDIAVVQPIINSIGAYVYLVDVLEDGNFCYFAFNQRMAEDEATQSMGFQVGRRPEEFLAEELASMLNGYYRRCVDHRATIEFENMTHTAVGRHWVSHSLAPLFYLDGRIGRILATVVDITQRKQAELALRESQERYQALYDDNPARLTTSDPNGVILSVNKFGAQYAGFRKEEMVNTSVFDHLHPDDREAGRGFVDQVLREPHKLHHAEFRSRNKHGNITWESNTARAATDQSGNRVILFVSEDTTMAHALAELLSYQATHDPLTGLVNRREFERRLKEMLDSAREENAQHVLCYLDLDQFKLINDTCGHVAGDELLCQLGRSMREKVRDQDTLARLGGDEFALLLENTPLDEAQQLSRMLCQRIEDYHFIWEGRSFSVGVSIGVVPIGSTSGTITNVLKAADTACYIAKEGGRSRVHVHHENDEELRRRRGEMEWVNRIKQAMREHRLHLYSQPIAPTCGSVVPGEHFELLLRLVDEEGQMVPSDEVLPAAERYGFGSRLDEWVIEHAFKWLGSDPENLRSLFLCAINLSGSSLNDASFLQFVISKLQQHNIPPNKICFEITENVAITNLSRARRFIEALKKLGCRFALDDFGTGVSSLAYLKNFPVDYLKIDGAFVKNIVDDPLDLAMVKSINEISHVMGKKTIAEFVQNDAIARKLAEIGVDYSQGYEIGRPEPIRTKLSELTAV